MKNIGEMPVIRIGQIELSIALDKESNEPFLCASIHTDIQREFEEALKKLREFLEHVTVDRIVFHGAGSLEFPDGFYEFCKGSGIEIEINRNALENRYTIKDLYVIDNRTGQSIYIRRILDVASAEFESSKVNPEKLLDIIANLGMDSLTEVLRQCYKMKEKRDNAAFDAALALSVLLRKVYPDFNFPPVLPSEDQSSFMSQTKFALRLCVKKQQ
jgi:hypothetical protein